MFEKLLCPAVKRGSSSLENTYVCCRDQKPVAGKEGLTQEESWYSLSTSSWHVSFLLLMAPFFLALVLFSL